MFHRIMAFMTRPRAELFFLAGAVGLKDFAAVAVKDESGERMAGFLHGEEVVHVASVAVVLIDESEEMQRFRDPSVLGDGSTKD